MARTRRRATNDGAAKMGLVGFTCELTVEDVAENIATIRAEDGYAVPGNLNEEMGLALKALSGA